MSCSICSQLRGFHYACQTHGRPDEDTFLPKVAERLRRVKYVKPGSDRYTSLVRCPECGTYYLFEVDWENLATGSEETQSLTRLTAEQAAAYTVSSSE